MNLNKDLKSLLIHRDGKTKGPMHRSQISMELEKVHVVLFPYMSKGHMIPMLQLARLLLSHSFAGENISVTVFTTPLNHPFVADSLSGTKATIVDIPFPKNVPEIPPGVECTDKLSALSSSLFVPFTRATKSMQSHFERELMSLPRVSFMVSDGFLWWTLESAQKLGFPRLVFLGMNCFSTSVLDSVFQNQLLANVKSETEPVCVPEFPWIKVRKCDFVEEMLDPTTTSDLFKLVLDHVTSTNQSQGIIFNTFDELEPVCIDFYKRKRELKPWILGPLCFADNILEDKSEEKVKSVWMKWLDEKRDKGCYVLYVAFGSQSEISSEQLEEIALGLEDSKVNFLWVVKGNIIGKGFEDRVGERGMVVRDEWVDQRKILDHESVRGFLSHCGWNSLMESICSEVPILAFPVAAEQPLNAILVVEELRVAERVVAASEGIVRREEVVEKVKELMEGEKGKELRKNVESYGKMAKKALEEGIGSSWKNLDNLINEFCKNGT